MRHPLHSRSLADFWGRRWNTGFNTLARELIFKPLAPSIGAMGATTVVFLISGVLHDLVISVPARGGYGLPTIYFLIQLVGLAFERTALLRRLLRRRAAGWLYALLFTITPLPLLFHEPFVRRVILPFLHAIGALP
jgi:alginate O-acetyltransferase complex protein AlgI